MNVSGQIRINNAKVVVADIQASNGIIHVIDAVLIPPR
ncbi:fasciclin domain-containing protein [Synechococcus sp. R6-5]